jgi:hypothetical protein
MVEGIAFMLVASGWFVFRRRIAAYQVYLITERFRVLPVRDKAEQVQGMEDIGVLFCALLFGAGALMVVLHILFD